MCAIHLKSPPRLRPYAPVFVGDEFEASLSLLEPKWFPLMSPLILRRHENKHREKEI